MVNHKIGLLPLYLKLYDDTCAYMRPRIEEFKGVIVSELESRGIEIIPAPVSRVSEEFHQSVRYLEEQGAAAIITLHLAYSPSLECVEALSGTKLPLIVLDTTQQFSFDSETAPEEIMYNHGIHGVQDMCNLLLRNNKSFEIFAGHYKHSDVLDRTISACKGAIMAHSMKHSKVGIVGGPFEGMGDFAVPYHELYTDMGISVEEYHDAEGAARIAKIAQSEIDQEFEADKALFHIDSRVTRELYDKTARVSLGVRKWMEEKKLSALTINFLATADSNPGLPVMPFTECSKAMQRGIGYAGEGDVLTAAFMGSVLSVFPLTTFTEMFCPNWEGNSVFLSHMGELNYAVCVGKPTLTEKDFPFTNADNPTVAYGTFQSGDAVFVNLAPTGKGTYSVIAAKGRVVSPKSENKLSESVNGWFQPSSSLDTFLESFSKLGGTHHSVLVYGDCINELRTFAKFMSFHFQEL